MADIQAGTIFSVSGDIRDKMEEYARQTQALHADLAMEYLGRDMHHGVAPEGFDEENELHRSLVSWGVRRGVSAAISVSMSLELAERAQEEEKAEGDE